MTNVPMTAMAVLPVPSPVCVGDTDSLCDLIARAKDGAVTCQEHAATASAGLEDARGGAVRALGAKLGHLQTSASLVEQSATSALLAARGYARAVDSIHVNAQAIEQEVALLLVRVRTSAATIEEIGYRKGVWSAADWRTPPPLFMPQEPGGAALTLASDADSFNWSQAASTWSAAVAALDSACVRWRGLVTQREDAEQALVGALARTVLVASGPGASAPSTAVLSSLTALLSTAHPWEPVPVQRLLDGILSPAEVAKLWQQLEDDGTDTASLIDKYSFELAGLDGLPFGVRDRAARAALDYALNGKTELAHAFARLGLSPDDMTLAEFRRDLVAVKDAVDKTERESGGRTPVQLVMLGSHDGAVTAAISVGDLDVADRVGVLVSGMNSTVRGMGEAAGGFQEVHDGSGRAAMVTWIGYRAPNIAEEAFQGRAERGSWPLASFLEGISTSRGDNPPSRLVLLGHSYGTNVAAEALKFGGHGADAFVSIGSAGLKHGTKTDDLGIDEIHATHASGDNIAPVGKKLHFRPTSNGGPGYLPRVDPRDLEGAKVFSSEASDDGKAVTMHNLTLPIDWGAAQWAADSLDGVASADEVGYLDPASTTVKQLKKIMGGQR